MATIKAKRNGNNVTSVVPDYYAQKEMQQLHARGYTNIENKDTGEKYEYCKECMSTPCMQQ